MFRSRSRRSSSRPSCRACRVYATPAVSSSPTSSVVEIVMPQLGVSVAEGTLVAWRKRAGEQVDADEAICDVSTDKIDSEVPAPCAGRIAAILVQEGETVAVGTVIATLDS